jgi:hypothetical protein
LVTFPPSFLEDPKDFLKLLRTVLRLKHDEATHNWVPVGFHKSHQKWVWWPPSTEFPVIIGAEDFFSASRGLAMLMMRVN